MADAASAEVRFRAAFDAPRHQDRSRLLADYVVAPLSTFRVKCSPPRDVDDGSVFGCLIGERRFEVLVAELEDQENEWRISIRSGLGWLSRRFRARDDDELLHLARVLHKVLSDGARIEGVTWHGLERLDGQPGRHWWEYTA